MTYFNRFFSVRIINCFNDFKAAGEISGMGGEASAVKLDGIQDPRMQNSALLGRLAAMKVIPGLEPAVIEEVLKEIVPPAALEENLKIFRSAK